MKSKTLGLIGVVILAFFFFVAALPKSEKITIQAASQAPVKIKKSVQKGSQNPSDPKVLYQQAMNLEQKGQFLEARKIYNQILVSYPDFEQAQAVQDGLQKLNLNLIISNIPVEGKTELYEVVPGDSLAKIAKKYNETIALIQKSNNLKSEKIRPGQKLRMWKGKFSVFVDKSQNILMLKDDDAIVKIYNVSTGSNNSTPVGTFKINVKQKDPVWFTNEAVIPPDSPKNQLGTRWMGFDLKGYGIHGTIDPGSIGQQVTAGCVRMRNQEVEELYDILPMGTQVTIVD